jgi:hypothetical protein
MRPALVANDRDQIDKPSIAYWRDHSAGASRRRVTPMPRGSRPSTAVFTSSGARNASEIVMWTCRMLHFFPDSNLFDAADIAATTPAQASFHLAS